MSCHTCSQLAWHVPVAEVGYTYGCRGGRVWIQLGHHPITVWSDLFESGRVTPTRAVCGQVLASLGVSVSFGGTLTLTQPGPTHHVQDTLVVGDDDTRPFPLQLVAAVDLEAETIQVLEGPDEPANDAAESSD